MLTPPLCDVEQWTPLTTTQRGSVLHASTLDSHGRPINVSFVDACIGICKVELQKSGWISQRIGPFISTGGYDWWLLTLTDLFELTTGEVLATSFMATDEKGNSISYPPLHSHHTHVAPLGVNVNLAVLMEQHGDWLTNESECIPSCSAITRLLPNYFNVTAPLQLIAAMNDVRFQGSPSMSWYYQAAVLISRRATTDTATTGTGGTALSKHYIWSPATPGAPFGTFYIPCSRETFMVFHGTLPLSGKSVRFNFHAHMSNFQAALLFSASPTALKVPLPKTRWKSFQPADISLKTNSQMQQQLMEQPIAKSSLVCSAVARYVEIDGVIYDRHAQMNCTAWTFERGAPFTVLSFNGPSARGTCGNLQVTQHAHWWLTYVARDMRSHYTEGFTQVMTQITTNQPFGHRRWFLHGGTMLAMVSLLKKSTRIATPLIL